MRTILRFPIAGSVPGGGDSDVRAIAKTPTA